MTLNPALEEDAELFALGQRALVLKRHGVSYDRAYRTRVRWERRWTAAMTQAWVPLGPNGAVLDQLSKPIVKRRRSVELLPRLEAALARWAKGAVETFARGALAVYMSLVGDTTEDAGQHTLDALGLNSTFRWTTVRDMPGGAFAVRGSKVIQNAHGEHLDALRSIIADATRPERPRTQAQVRKEIRDRWTKLSRMEAARIARTETAHAWEWANYNTAVANEVEEFDWLIGHGPSIGPPKSHPVCDLCLAAAAGGPYRAGSGFARPPRHPNCRCTLVPKLAEDWLPPARTWSGGPNPPLPLESAPAP